LNLIDYHLHTGVTIDGKMNEKMACEKAVSMGIYEIAFTNHVMLTKPDYRMPTSLLSDHWEKIQDCQVRYPELKIRIGIEVDYYLDREKEIATIVNNYEQILNRPFDLILGSVHEIRGGFFSNKNHAPDFFKGQDLIALYREYFDLSTRAVQSRIYDIIAHPDLIKKYTYQLTPPVSFDKYISSAERFIDSLIDCQVGIEVNTKGLKLPVNETYPSNAFLELYLSKIKTRGSQTIISLASDAHKVDDVGYGLSETAENLLKLGLTALTGFEKRTKYTLPMI
jgi:histidinol-phosphatase (PHP family)